MTRITVTTQAELDSALTNPDHACATHEIIIDSPAGVWIEVSDDHGQDVRAYGSSSVRAYGSATVHATGSATVHATGSSTVHAYGSSTVWAFNSSTVTATSTVSIHKTNDLANITGGVVIDHTTTDATTPTRWATENGASVSGGEVKLYKALPDDLTSGLLYWRPTV